MGGTVPEVVFDALSVVQVCSVRSEKALGREELSAELELELCRFLVSAVSFVKGRGSGLGGGIIVVTSMLEGSSFVGGGVSSRDWFVGLAAVVGGVLSSWATSIVAGGLICAGFRSDCRRLVLGLAMVN